MKCDFCQKQIQGQYWQYENGKKVCFSCHNSLPQCYVCGLPTRKGLSQKGRTICPSCQKKVKQCAFCHSFLLESYKEIGGVNVCSHCFDSLPRCVRCHMPMQEYLVLPQKQKLCLSCSHTIAHCAMCQIPLIDKYYQFPEDKRKFCSTCASEKRRCDTCGLPLTPVYHILKDNRSLCSLCMQKAVRTPEQAKEILNLVLAFLQNELCMKIRKTTSLSVVDSQTLAQIRKQIKSPGNKDRRALGCFLRRNESFEVYIETFLPYALCMGVLSHEYTHAWQAEYFSPNAPILWIEGMAEWVSYHTLLYYGHKKQASLIPKQQDEYGQGFHKVWALEKKHSISYVIQNIAKIAKNASSYQIR